MIVQSSKSQKMGGHTLETKKKLIHRLFNQIEIELEISPIDIEIKSIECPACKRGFRGICDDQAKLKIKSKSISFTTKRIFYNYLLQSKN